MFFRINSISSLRSHAELIFRTVIKTLWMWCVVGFGGGGGSRSLCHRHVEKRWFFRVKRIQQSTASMRTSRLLLNQQIHETRVAARMMCYAGRLSAKSGHQQASIASAPRVCWDTAAPQFSNGLKKEDYFRGIGSVSLFIQRIVGTHTATECNYGDISSVAAAKLSVFKAKRAWLEPWTHNIY